MINDVGLFGGQGWTLASYTRPSAGVEVQSRPKRPTGAQSAACLDGFSTPGQHQPQGAGTTRPGTGHALAADRRTSAGSVLLVLAARSRPRSRLSDRWVFVPLSFSFFAGSQRPVPAAFGSPAW